MKDRLKMGRRDDEKGFTLIEVMFTIFLITVGVMAIAKMQVYALKADRIAYNQTEAAMYAANQAETLINQPFDDDSAGQLLTIGDHGPVQAGPGNKYSIVWTVANPESGDTNTKVIQLFVSWTDQDGTKRMNFAYVRTASNT